MHTMTQQEFNQGTDKVWQISQKEPLLVVDEAESCRVILPFSLYQQLIQNSKNSSKLTEVAENPFNFDLDSIQKSIESGFKPVPKFDTAEELANYLSQRN